MGTIWQAISTHDPLVPGVSYQATWHVPITIAVGIQKILTSAVLALSLTRNDIRVTKVEYLPLLSKLGRADGMDIVITFKALTVKRTVG
jgi:hypothetical protein